MPYFVVIAGLLLIVLIHELGHFLAARSVGVRATRFMVGFPPRLFSFRRGDTEYGLGAVLLGGYVRLAGMFRPTSRDAIDRLERDARQVGTSAGAEEQVEAALAAIARAEVESDLRAGLQLLDVALADAGPALDGDSAAIGARVRARRRIADLFEDLHTDAYWRASLWRRMWVIAAGPLANILTGGALLFVLAMWFSPIYSADWTVSEIDPGSPAERAGLAEGDVIRSWNGVDGNDDDFREAVRATGSGTVELEVERSGGEQRRYRMVPEEIDGEPRIGIRFQPENIERTGTRDTDFQEAAGMTWDLSTRLVQGMLAGLVRLIHEPEAREDVGTVVGVVQDAPEIQEQGRGWEYLAFLSFVIAIFNLLPLLPLDGGHLAFGLVEALRRRPLPRLAFEQASFVGLGLILVLFAMGLQNDLNR